MRLICRAGWLILLLILLPAAQARSESVKLYFYHQQPPFVLGDVSQHQGLMFDLAQLLEKHASPGIALRVEALPRARLNLQLNNWINGSCALKAAACANDWLVFWVAPAWGWGEQPEQRYRWVELFQDEDLIVSNVRKPIDYQAPASLIGSRFASIRGHSYPLGLGQLMSEGRVIRTDTNNQRATLRMVAKGRADVTLIQRSALEYYFQHEPEFAELSEQLHIARKPFKSFMLQVMLPADRPDLEQWLLRSKADPAWAAVFARFGIQTPLPSEERGISHSLGATE